jgi:hypothetical protein
VGAIWFLGFVCSLGGFEVRIPVRDVDEVEVSGGHMESPFEFVSVSEGNEVLIIIEQLF